MRESLLKHFKTFIETLSPISCLSKRVLQRRPQQSTNTWSNVKYRTSMKIKNNGVWAQINNKKKESRFIENFISPLYPSHLNALDPGTSRDGGERRRCHHVLFTPCPSLGLESAETVLLSLSILYKWQKNVHFVFVGFYKSGPHFDEVDDSFRIHSVYFSISRLWRSELVTGRRTDSF